MGTAALVGVILSAVLAAAGLAVNARQTAKANEQQREHDLAMAALNHKYREEEAANSFEREAVFNQYAADESKMRAAGVNPALMYGQSMATSTPQVSSVGSSQSAGNVGRFVNASDFLGRLDPSEYAEQAIQRMNARTMAEKTKSDIQLQNQLRLESAAKTAASEFDTSLRKRLETTIFDLQQQQLKGIKIANETADFDLHFAKDTRELEIERRQIDNVRIRKDIALTVEKIRTEPVARMKLGKEMDEIEAATSNYYANADVLQENLRGSQLERIMKEFGLNARTINPMLRNGELLNAPYRVQMKGAQLALQELGYSEFEATNAVLYYMATDPKQVTPSLVNGVSRILASTKK